MNDHERSGQWKQIKGKLRAQWGKLTDDELEKGRGNTEYLVGKIQERYGATREEAEKQLRELQQE